MYTVYWYRYPHGMEDEAMTANWRDFDSLEKAINFLNGRAKLIKSINWAGGHVEDENRNWLYEIDWEGNEEDNREKFDTTEPETAETEAETAEPETETVDTEPESAETETEQTATDQTEKQTENGFNYKRNLVLADNSQIFKNWSELTGISKDKFLEALEWVCNDPLTEWGRITRKIGLTETGIVKLNVVRSKGFTAVYHNGKLWGGGFFNVPCPEKYKDFSGDGKTIRVNQKITLSCKDRV